MSPRRALTGSDAPITPYRRLVGVSDRAVRTVEYGMRSVITDTAEYYGAVCRCLCLGQVWLVLRLVCNEYC
jgi:hypothetical protein